MVYGRGSSLQKEPHYVKVNYTLWSMVETYSKSLYYILSNSYPLVYGRGSSLLQEHMEYVSILHCLVYGRGSRPTVIKTLLLSS